MIGIKSVLLLLVSTNLLIMNSQGQSSSALVSLYHPSYFVFNSSPSSVLELSDFKNLLLAGSGFSINKPIKWNGLTSTDPLMWPKFTLLLLADKNSIDISSTSNNTISVDQDTNADFSYLKSLVAQGKVAVEIYNQLPETLDLSTLEKDCSKDSVFYIYTITETSNSVKLLGEINGLFQNISQNCAAITDPTTDLLVYLLAADLTESRSKRQAGQSSVGADQNTITNEAEFFSDQYPAMFNILFWTSLILAITVFAVSYSMCYLDPGLNTVIYRMTSQRIKKEQ